MSLDAALVAALDSVRDTCPVRLALAEWADADWLAARLVDTAVPSSVLAALFYDRTPRLSAAAIRDHRAGDCPCVIPLRDDTTHA